MTNRTEILHFRATPEEKGRIKENAGHAELHLSEWMRQRSLDRLVPTQPAVEGTMARRIKELGGDMAGDMGYQDILEEVQAEDETYEQFMERRVGELVGMDDPTTIQIGKAREVAEAEWAERL